MTPRAVAIDNTISSLGVAFAEALTHRHRHTITHLTAGHDDLLERFETLRQRFPRRGNRRRAHARVHPGH